MNKLPKRIASIVLICSLFGGIAVAQQMGGGPGPNRPPMTPAVAAKMQAWRTWRESHKHVDELGRTIRGLVQLELNPKLKLNKDQARTDLAVITRWRVKPAITDAQAASVTQQLTGKLSKAQTAAFVAATARRGGPGGPGGWGGHPGGPGGPPRPGSRGAHGGPPPPGGLPPAGGPGGWGGHPGGQGGPGGPGGHGFDFSKMPAPHDYNPLNPPTIPMERQRQHAQETLDTLVAFLKAT